MKKININILVLIALCAVCFVLWRLNRNLKSEVKRLNGNISVAYSDFENRIDDLGNKFSVVEASVFTKKEFEKYSGDISEQLRLSGIKTKNIINAGLAGIESNYHFTVIKDTVIGGDTVIIESYSDQWINFGKIGNNATVVTFDTVLYSTFKERDMTKPWLFRWLYKKKQKELFKSLSPYSKITFLKVNNIRK